MPPIYTMNPSSQVATFDIFVHTDYAIVTMTSEEPILEEE
jgi:hypothetical protein